MIRLIFIPDVKKIKVVYAVIIYCQLENMLITLDMGSLISTYYLNKI